MARPELAAVIFDLGGVVLDSPLDVIDAYERDEALAPGSINQAVVSAGPDGAWARHERGEVSRAAFLVEWATELRRHGLDVRTADLMDRIEESFHTRPEMVTAIRRIREKGMAVAAITNNWTPFPERGVRSLFDVFVESVVEGVRKPEPAIYRRCLWRLGIEAPRAVMLDDLGPNLKPARQMGMLTVKVASPHQGLVDLGEILGFALTSDPGPRPTR